MHNNNCYRQILGLQLADTKLSSKSMSISEVTSLIDLFHFCEAQRIHYIFHVANIIHIG